MKYLSVCSGIEAATVAWHPLGWEPVAFSEIEAFPSAVLKYHYPHVSNWGDMTKYQEWPDADVDVLVGGTPCQSFSVAGLRKGLDDPRGNLMLTYLAIARRYRPEWVVWENVPGVLSSNGGRDFAALLRGLDELGYGWAYRVLDAQYYGVAQRRRRVFVIGHSGGWQRAAAVLFERASLSGHPAPRREARERPSKALDAGAEGRRWPADCASTLNAHYGDKWGLEDQHALNGAELFVPVAHSLRADGFDASEDATGRGTPLVPVGIFQDSEFGVQQYDSAGTLRAGRIPEHQMVMQPIAFHNRQDPDIGGDITHPLGAQDNGMAVAFDTTTYRGSDHADAEKAGPVEALRTLRGAVGEKAFTVWSLGILASLQSPEVLRSAMHGLGFRLPAFSRSWVVNRALSREKGGAAWLLQSLRETGCEGCPPQGWEPSEQLTGELGAYLSELSQPGAQAARFMRDLRSTAQGSGLLREALSAVQEVGRSAHGQGQPAHGVMQVRRLTVEECEFLQGFPRGYTLIQYRGKPAADGPRYKSLGNSMAVPVMHWIGKRIAAVESLPQHPRRTAPIRVDNPPSCGTGIAAQPAPMLNSATDS